MADAVPAESPYLMSRSSPHASRGTFLDVASDAAWQFRAYDAYGGNESTACRAIRRRCPGFTLRQCTNAFAKALELYDVVEQLVREHAKDLWAAHDSGDKSWPGHFDDQLRSRFTGFRLATFHSLVGMMFYYWHMR